MKKLANKTEIMKIHTSDTQRIKTDNAEIKEVDKFAYLRCKIKKDGDVRNEIGIRIEKPEPRSGCSTKYGTHIILLSPQNVRSSIA